MFKEEIANQFEDLGDGVYLNRETGKIKVMYEGWEIEMRFGDDGNLKIISQINYTGGSEYQLTSAMRKAVIEKVKKFLKKRGFKESE